VAHVQSGDQPTLLAAAQVATPDELRSDPHKRLEHQAKSLPGLLAKMGVKSKRIACAIPSWATVCKHMQLTKADPAGIAQQVAALTPLQLQCDPSAIRYKYIEITPPGAAKPEVIVMAVSNELIQLLMRWLREGKLEPVGMHTEFAALLGCFDCLHRRTGDENINTLYLDIGQATTCVGISHGKQLAFARVVDIGGGAINESLAQQLSCTTAQAAEKRRTEMATLDSRGVRMGSDLRSIPSATPTNIDIDRRAGATPAGLSEYLHALPEAQGTAPPALREALETLTDEVRMCVRFHAAQFSQHKISRIVFTGGEAMHHGACQHIAAALKIPGHVADPFARLAGRDTAQIIGIDMQRAQPGWVVALGACSLLTDL
jgi:Tfp pilus assembly PilM family ATPase